MNLTEYVLVCPVCESLAYRRYEYLWVPEYVDVLMVNECLECGCHYISPRMTEEETRQFYVSEYREMLPHTVANYTPEIDEIRKRKRAEVIASQIDMPVTSHLDIGCAKGELLRRVDAFISAGVEWNKEDQTSCGYFTIFEELANVSIPQFDLITAIQVLEHVGDPHKFIQQIKQRLLPGGRLILEVPNVNYDFYPVPYHVVNYSERALRILAEKNDMKVRRLFAYKGYQKLDKPFYIFAEFLNNI